MSWNYRVLRREADGDVCYAIHEVYYNAEGKPDSCTVTAVYPCGETLDELRMDFERYAEAFTLPTLDWADLGHARDE